MSASKSAFSDAEEELSLGTGPSERKRQRSVEKMFNPAAAGPPHHPPAASNKCCAEDQRLKELETQIEERHSRGTNLILWSEQFGKRKDGEDIEEVAESSYKGIQRTCFGVSLLVEVHSYARSDSSKLFG